MVHITSDNAETQNILEQLCTKIEECGGSIHPNARIACHHHAIQISVTGEDAEGPLFQIPHEALVVYDDFALKIEDGLIKTHSTVDGIAPVQRDLMELILALYNVTGKLQAHLDSSAWHVFKDDPEILRLLQLGRQGGDAQMIAQFIKDGMYEELALLTFFKTRLLNCQLYKKDAPMEMVLMPLADLMDHTLKGAIYKQLYYEGGATLNVPLSRPVEGSNECFMSYGAFDSFDTYLHYNFIDAQTPFVRSVPVNINLGEWGQIDIRALNAHVPTHDIPEGFKDLSFYMPIINIHESERRAVLSHLMIPGRAAPKSLRRILSLTLQSLHPTINAEHIKILMLQVEDLLLKANLAYYNDLEAAVRDSYTKDTKKDLLTTLIARQHEILGFYAEISAA